MSHDKLTEIFDVGLVKSDNKILGKKTVRIIPHISFAEFLKKYDEFLSKKKKKKIRKFKRIKNSPIENKEAPKPNFENFKNYKSDFDIIYEYNLKSNIKGKFYFDNEEEKETIINSTERLYNYITSFKEMLKNINVEEKKTEVSYSFQIVRTTENVEKNCKDINKL